MQKDKNRVDVDRQFRTIWISGPVDWRMSHEVVQALQELDRSHVHDDIRIILNSEGGDEASGYAIYDAILQCQSKVVIEVYGSAMSMGAAILQAADVRRMAPNAQFMIHNGSMDEMPEEADFNTAEILVDQFRKDTQRYYNILSAASQQPLELIQAWCDDETYFNAEETVAAGFADEIIKPVKQKFEPVMETPDEE